MKTAKEIKEALKSNTFNVYMKVQPESMAVYRVIGARTKNGTDQVKTQNSRARNGYLWWTITSVMSIYTQ
jgi:hypothetical protein